MIPTSEEFNQQAESSQEKIEEEQPEDDFFTEDDIDFKDTKVTSIYYIPTTDLEKLGDILPQIAEDDDVDMELDLPAGENDSEDSEEEKEEEAPKITSKTAEFLKLFKEQNQKDSIQDEKVETKPDIQKPVLTATERFNQVAIGLLNNKNVMNASVETSLLDNDFEEGGSGLSIGVMGSKSTASKKTKPKSGTSIPKPASLTSTIMPKAPLIQPPPKVGLIKSDHCAGSCGKDQGG